MINSFIKKYKEIEEAIEREVKSSTNAESSGTYASSSREPVSRAESQTPSTMFFNSVAMGSESPQRGSGGVNENQTSLPPRSLSAEPSTGNTQGFDALIAENEKLKEMLQFVKTKAKAKISSLQEEVNQLKANNDATQKDSEQQRSDDIDTSGATVKSINTSLDEYKSRVTELEQRNLELNEALSAAVDDLSRLKQYERDSHLLPETTTSYNKELQTEPVVNEHEALSVSLQAQVKELKSQLALISKDAAEFSEVVKRLKEEKQSIIVAHEEKLKKIKDLFAVGNKNLAELKETLSQKETLLDVKIAEIAAKDTRIVQLENQLRESLEALRQTYDERDALQSGASAQASEFEAKFKSAQEELNRTRLDFQAYKNRAYAVLQERQNDQQQKILSDLEVKIAKLEAEKNAVAKSLEASLLRTKELDTSLQTSLDINSALQKRLDELHSFEEQYENAKEELRQEILNKKAFQQSLQEDIEEKVKQANMASEVSKKEYQQQIESLRAALLQKDSDLKSFQGVVDSLNDNIERFKDQVMRKEAEILSLKQKQSFASQEVSTSLVQAQPSEQLFKPLGELLAHGNDASYTKGVQSKQHELERKIVELSELLEESEEANRLHEQQQKVLKEELRKLDRVRVRKDVSNEYLKNVVLRFIEQPTESLVPVLNELLLLEPEEVEKVKNAVRQQTPTLSVSFWQ